jgi:pyruvate/2-oxoglutarate dehydrogenase complex dihydrolipoamide dehydrogenase (E3) component
MRLLARGRLLGVVTLGSGEPVDVLVIGGGPAGVVAALRAARLGARTVLVTRDHLGGMAANDGPVPVRVLAHAARLIRDADQLSHYGIDAEVSPIDYPRLLARVRSITGAIRERALLRDELAPAGVTIHEQAGNARFIGPRLVECENGVRVGAEKVIVCTGGVSRELPLPGFELTRTHSDAWGLDAVPATMTVVGGGATGVQVASVFNALGSRVTLFEAGPRILASEDGDVASEMAGALRATGITVLEGAGKIDELAPCPTGVRLVYSSNGSRSALDAEIVVAAVGWVANTDGLGLDVAGVETNERGFIAVDAGFRTSAAHVFAAGDVTGGVMVVHEAVREAYLAAASAVLGQVSRAPATVSPLGSFTDPEYASVGLSEESARRDHEIVVGIERFAAAPRPIIDGRPVGFCKVIVDRETRRLLGCHIVGERAVELAQVAAVAMAAELTVDQLALIPFSFPTYANVLARAAIRAARPFDDTLEDAGLEFALTSSGA